MRDILSRKLYLHYHGLPCYPLDLGDLARVKYTEGVSRWGGQGEGKGMIHL